ncbi:hypothetical protein [Brevundimonas diminuta]|uniref:hypothetical protein n=1 Tax=Brevundimonas diminuta TaxID=293 RepID=UPI003CFBFD38
MTAALFPPGHPRHIPEAWPALLSRDQLRAYVGGMSDETLSKVCPVAPVELGANLLRYPRDQVDRWVAGLQPRPGGLRKSPPEPKIEPTPPDDPVGAGDHAARALERIRARAKGSRRCRTMD